MSSAMFMAVVVRVAVAMTVVVSAFVVITVIVRMFVIVRMIVAVCVIVCVAVIVRMAVIVRVTVMLVVHALRERVVLGERRVMTVTMPAAIRARLGLERQFRALDLRAEALEHVFEHRIGFELQFVDAHFHGRMAIAEVIRRAREREAVVRAHAQHALRRRDHAHEAAVVGDQHVAVTQHRAARQHHAHVLARVEPGREAALAALVVGEREGGRALDQHGREFGVESFVDRAHINTSNFVLAVRESRTDQNRKYRCAIGSTVAGSQVSNWPSATTW
ncbi:hypothetical protein PT2222_90314 [Paraburkholderia tropica]